MQLKLLGVLQDYDSPYASLECGVLRIDELNMTQPDREDMWWLD